MNAEEIVKSFREEFGKNIVKDEIRRRKSGKKAEIVSIWMEVKREIFKDAVKHLFSIQDYPHFGVSSGNDMGDDIEIVHHFTVNYGKKHEQILINISVKLPKSDPTIDSICDLIPGALIAEREKQEMLGITVNGIPDSRRIFLPDDFPKGIYPWRKDEKNADKLARNLHDSEVVKKSKW